MDDDKSQAVHRYYEVGNTGHRTDRICYCLEGSLPPRSDESKWIRDTGFDEAAEIKRTPHIQSVLDLARANGTEMLWEGQPINESTQLQSQDWSGTGPQGRL